MFRRKISEIIIIDSESDSDEEHTDDGVSKAAANYSLLDHIDGSDELLSDETIADGVKRKSLTSVKPKYQEYDVNLNEARGTRHKEGRYKCGHCPKSFRSVPMLIEHYLSIHESKHTTILSHKENGHSILWLPKLTIMNQSI